MKKNLEIKKLGINGEGIGYIDRKIVFVPGALPQEEVVVDLIRQTRSYYEGKLVKVIKPSKNRVVPRCKAYNDCQGCTLLHLNYYKQRLKLQLLFYNLYLLYYINGTLNLQHPPSR